MTEEEMKARIEELESSLSKAETEKKAALGEKFSATKALKDAQDAAEEAAEEAERAKGDITALEKRLGDKFQKQLDDANKRADTAENGLRSFKAESEISKLLVANKVQTEDHDLVSTYIRSLLKHGEDGSVLVGDKPLSDFGTEFFGGAGKRYVSAAANSGGGATGGTSQVIKSHGYTKENFSERMTEWSMFAKSNPAEAKQIAVECGRSDLASDL